MQNTPAISEVAPDVRPFVLNDIAVRTKGGKRVVSCFCGEDAKRSIVPHMKREHSQVWEQWVQNFVYLRSMGFPLKRIMRLYRAGNGPLLFSWTVVEREFRRAVENGSSVLAPAPIERIEQWQPIDFELAKGTVWDFPKRGDWAVHSSDYRGNWPPQLVRNLILRFTKPNDLIVDAFSGGGTTLIESWLCGRKSVGFDISKLALQVTQGKLETMDKLAQEDGRVSLQETHRPTNVEGDALLLAELVERQDIALGTVQMVCAHPPYLDSLEFTNKDERDLSSIKDPEVFYQKIEIFAQHAYNVLADQGLCALLIGDVKKNGTFIPLGYNTASRFQQQGFTLEIVIIKTQNWDRTTEFYRNKNGMDFLLEHEYLFILRK